MAPMTNIFFLSIFFNVASNIFITFLLINQNLFTNGHDVQHFLNLFLKTLFLISRPGLFLTFLNFIQNGHQGIFTFPLLSFKMVCHG